LEKSRFVDQKADLKFPAIREFILSHRQVFLRQGSIAATWRSYRGARLGPFFALRYRMGGRQKAVYLGQSAALAEQVRVLLREIQQDRQIARLQRQARAELRKQKKLWAQDLASLGLRLKGFEVCGWRALEGAGLPVERTSKEGGKCSRA
jgi:hypothetical protein